MSLLLDSHALLWCYLNSPLLSTTAASAILDPTNVVYVSPASYWEIAIKVSIGKYKLNESFDDFIQHAIFDNGFSILPVEPKHAAELVGLPFHHKDSFDRLLIAQAVVESFGLISADKEFDAYPITRIW